MCTPIICVVILSLWILLTIHRFGSSLRWEFLINTFAFLLFQMLYFISQNLYKKKVPSVPRIWRGKNWKRTKRNIFFNFSYSFQILEWDVSCLVVQNCRHNQLCISYHCRDIRLQTREIGDGVVCENKTKQTHWSNLRIFIRPLQCLDRSY